jgi:hypothetical protein
MERQAANSLRILGIVVTSVVVIAGCLALAYMAFFIVMIGGMTRQAQITHPRASQSFYGLILAVIAFVTAGILIIGRLAKGIVRGPVPVSGPPPQLSPSAASGAVRRSAPPQSVPPSKKTRSVDRLALALCAHIAVSTITWFQIASRFPIRTFALLLPFILSQAPDSILIYLLLKRPGRRAFTFLIALLAIPILNALFNPVFFSSYRQIFVNHALGSAWIALSRLIYIATLVLAYLAIQHTGLWPKASSVIFVTVAAFFYFFLVREITPFLYQVLG